jgi:hypothetical protein
MTVGGIEEVSPERRISASDTTWYLSAAPHLRRGMLREKVTGSNEPATPLQPVGRKYALQVLFGAQGAVPMPAVDTGEVRSQCTIALLQTTIRDATAVAALAISALLEPWGTAIVFGLAVAVIILVGRVRLFSLWTLTAVAAIALVLLAGIRREDARFAIPLICLGVCYAVFLVDILLSVHYLRWLRSISSAQPNSQHADPPQGCQAARPEENSQDSQGFSPQSFTEGEPLRIYHDRSRIIGSGAPVKSLGFHVSLESRLDEDEQITGFNASELLDYVSSHVISRRFGDAPENGQQSRDGHFTGGLPYLRVAPVISVPVPKAKKHPILRFSTVRLDYNYRPSDKELLDAADRPQVGQNERHYVRFITSSWRGQIVISIYCYAAIEADSLSVTIKPHVLTPIAEQFRVADDLVTQNRFLIAGRAVKMTARQFLSAAQQVDRLTGNGTAAPVAGLYSPRELYAGILAENSHQLDDASRIIRVLEAKVARVTMEFLRGHNIDPNEDEKRAFQSVHSYTIIGDIINAGPNSQVNNAKGDKIEQANKNGKTDS